MQTIFWSSNLILKLLFPCTKALKCQELELILSSNGRLKNRQKFHSIIQLNESQPNDFSNRWKFQSDDFFNQLKFIRLILRKYQLSSCEKLGWRWTVGWDPFIRSQVVLLYSSHRQNTHIFQVIDPLGPQELTAAPPSDIFRQNTRSTRCFYCS